MSSISSREISISLSLLSYITECHIDRLSYVLYCREIPQELVTLAEGGRVALDMEDHSSEDYVPPKQPKVRAFVGSGQTLGSESTSQVS